MGDMINLYSGVDLAQFAAPSNIDAQCIYCGHAIRSGELIIEGDFNNVTKYTHASCLEGEQQDARELEADMLRDALGSEDL